MKIFPNAACTVMEEKLININECGGYHENEKYYSIVDCIRD